LTRSITAPVTTGDVICTVLDAEVEPTTLDAVMVTTNVPAVANVCDGFAAVLVPPSPNVQAHEVGPPVEVSVNETLTGAAPEVVDAVNDAAGAVTTGGAVPPSTANQ
jgi:hypothetical protein